MELAGANGTGNGNGIWKWVAVVAVSSLLAGAPGYLNLMFASPTKNEVEFIRERQNTVLQRLATIEERLNNSQAFYGELREEVRELRDALEAHASRR